MVTKWISSEAVAARIGRNIKNVPSDYLLDIKEWIAEAVCSLSTLKQTATIKVTLNVEDYRAALPCKVESISALFHNGVRMYSGTDEGSIEGENGFHEIDDGIYSPTAFKTVIKPVHTKQGSTITSTIVHNNTKGTPSGNQHSYRLNYDSIETTVEKGKITAFLRVPITDEKGYPMMPDNETYHKAVYWYVRMMMFGAGIEDTVFKTYQAVESQWNRAAAAARNEVEQITPDEAYYAIMKQVRLLPSMYDWELAGNTEREYSYAW